MTWLKRRAGLKGSVIVLAGLAAGVVAMAQPTAAATTPSVQGVDVSGENTVTSWAAVKAAGMTFTGVQAFDGVEGNNADYAAQVTGALAAGLYVMPYVEADPLKIGGAAQFTQKAWPVIKGIAAAPYKTGGAYLPIGLALEAQPQVTTSECYGLSQASMKSWISAFINAVKSQAKVTPLIYTTAKWWQDCTGGTSSFGGAPLWVADYSDPTPVLPAGWSGYTFWQHSQTGAPSGIAAPADLDQFQGAATGKAGTSGSFQLRTLSSLAGQPVSYKAVKLPKGVTLTSAGKLSWTNATPLGALAVTVATTGTPATINETLLMHAPVTIAHPNRSSTVGKKVKLQLTTSGTDQKHGYTPAIRVSGLPPGLQETGNGLVTGTPSKAGVWAVTVTAHDNLDSAATAVFDWTIKK